MRRTFAAVPRPQPALAGNLWTKVWPVDSAWRMSEVMSTVAAMSIAGTTSWSERAERAERVLVTRFWDARRRLFRVSDRVRVMRSHWHYWWQAHALDACVDAAVRTGAAEAQQRSANLATGILRRNGG